MCDNAADAMHRFLSTRFAATLLSPRSPCFRSPSSGQSGETAPGKNELLVYIGTYTGAKSKGIYLSRLDAASGALSPPELAAETPSPSFLAVHPRGGFLYSVNEVNTSGGKPGGGGQRLRDRSDNGQAHGPEPAVVGRSGPGAPDRRQVGTRTCSWPTTAVAAWRRCRSSRTAGSSRRRPSSSTPAPASTRAGRRSRTRTRSTSIAEQPLRVRGRPGSRQDPDLPLRREARAR